MPVAEVEGWPNTEVADVMAACAKTVTVGATAWLNGNVAGTDVWPNDAAGCSKGAACVVITADVKGNAALDVCPDNVELSTEVA